MITIKKKNKTKPRRNNNYNNICTSIKFEYLFILFYWDARINKDDNVHYSVTNR